MFSQSWSGDEYDDGVTGTKHNAFGRPPKDFVVPLSVDQTVFLKTWLKRPMRTGAVVPSSNALARLITSDIVPNG